MAANYVIDKIHALLTWMCGSGGAIDPANGFIVNWYSAVSPAPSVDSVTGDFTPLSNPTDAGYATQNVTAWTDNGRVGNGWQFVSNVMTFTNSGGTPWTTALGVYVVDNGAVLISWIEFAAPITLGGGSTETLTIDPDDLNRY